LRARWVKQLLAELGELLTEDGFLKTMAQLVWYRYPALG
jgi:hypothetical protein